MRDFLGYIWESTLSIFSIARALLRLVLVSITFVLDGINVILFSRGEIVGYDFLATYLKKDDDKVSYLEKLHKQITRTEHEDDYVDEEHDGDFLDE